MSALWVRLPSCPLNHFPQTRKIRAYRDMKIYTESVVCDLCGGPGVATPRAAADRWFGGRVVHRDPSVCEHYIKEQREKDAKRIAELEAQLGAA